MRGLVPEFPEGAVGALSLYLEDGKAILKVFLDLYEILQKGADDPYPDNIGNDGEFLVLHPVR
ncbi:MAG: hypothetical protein BWY20_02189 [Spirochaetes bacterium ADurb.Bin215]|nr:MAG: hypothetical protein BWY20_02189 [Spirochaetes bacterium ADurb.Bin215]